jgi:hypothetical protein
MVLKYGSSYCATQSVLQNFGGGSPLHVSFVLDKHSILPCCIKEHVHTLHRLIRENRYRKPVGEQHASYNVVVQDTYVMSAIATSSLPLLIIHHIQCTRCSHALHT